MSYNNRHVTFGDSKTFFFLKTFKILQGSKKGDKDLGFTDPKLKTLQGCNLII